MGAADMLQDEAEESAKALFEMMEAYPRFKELGADPLHAPGERGALLLRGPLKLLQTVSKVTCAGSAADVASRFRVLLSRTKWMRHSEIEEMLSGVVGSDGFSGRLAAYDPAREYAAVVVAELESGLCCFHMVGGGYPESIPDSGPWLYVADHGRSSSGRRPGFSYTGTLRPFRVSPRRAVPDSIFKPDYFVDGDPKAEMAAPAKSTPPVLTPAQAKMVRRACLIGREIVDAAHRAIKPGVTTDEIDRIVHDKHLEYNAYPAPLNYLNFPKAVCTSVNEVVCHGIPDMRELEDGDIVNLDVSPIVDGWHADLNETVCVGSSVSEEKKQLIKAAHDSLMKAIDECKPGYFYRDLGAVITKHVNGCGFQVDKTYCGHGIGQYFHCAPNIPHYAGNKAKFTMKPGHCFTIEPMINAGTWKDVHWPDGWTAVTKDGKPSAQFEHQLLVGESGVEILTARLPTSPPLWWEMDRPVAATPML